MADDLADLTRELTKLAGQILVQGTELRSHVETCDGRAAITNKLLDGLTSWQSRFDSSFRGAVRIVATALLTLIASVVGAAALSYFQAEHAASVIATATVKTATSVDQNTQAWREQRAAQADAKAEVEIRALQEINRKLDRRK